MKFPSALVGIDVQCTRMHKENMLSPETGDAKEEGKTVKSGLRYEGAPTGSKSL